MPIVLQAAEANGLLNKQLREVRTNGTVAESRWQRVAYDVRNHTGKRATSDPRSVRRRGVEAGPSRGRILAAQYLRRTQHLRRWRPADDRRRLLGGAERRRPVGGRVPRRVRSIVRRLHVAPRLRAGDARHRATLPWLPDRHRQPTRDDAIQLPAHGQPVVLRQRWR